MERLTKSNVSIDSTASEYMGKEIKIQGMSDCLLDLILNGPTLNGVNKDVLRQIIRQLYDGLKHYEDMEEQGRLVVLENAEHRNAVMKFYNRLKTHGDWMVQALKGGADK